MTDMIKFNISASSYGVFKQSPLQFYYQYIIKANPDTPTIQSYGLAGNVVHKMLEEYNEGVKFDAKEEFHKRWLNKKLDVLPGISFNGRPGKVLDESKYLRALKYGIRMSDKLYNITENELYLNFPFVNDDIVDINIKGYIDFIAEKNEEVIIGDWKTNSSMRDFTVAAKMYHLLYYKEFGIMPIKASYEYLKMGKSKPYKFTLEDIMDFEKELYVFVETIKKWGTDISKYECGDLNSPFNAHRKKCNIEFEKRNNTTPINCVLRYNTLHFEKLPEKLNKIFTIKYSYCKDGVVFSEKYKSGMWDGRKYFFRKNTLPYGFIKDVEETIKDFNEMFNTKYDLIIDDMRDKNVTNKVFDTKFGDIDIVLRYYQEEAITRAILDRIGILALGCSAGKTIIAADLIKRLNRRTLFLVNRIELADQTKEELENYLGVEVGLMTEGNMDINKQITVASVQTIYSIIDGDKQYRRQVVIARRNGEYDKVDALNKKIEERLEMSNLLKKYLYNITCCIADEVQNVKDSGYYRSIYKNLANVVYCIGLSGTPWRTAGDTLEMNALEGFPIYKKLSDELTEEGFLTPSKCLFLKINNSHSSDKYNDAYVEGVVENDARNDIIGKIVETYGANKKILILTRRVKHAEILNELIPNSLVITGSTDKKKRKKNYETFKNTNGFVLIGSSKIFSSGIDIPDLDIIINASAHKSSIDSIQIIGRVKRKSEGKKMGYYIDFKDQGRFFDKASKERMDILKTFGEEVKIVDDLEGEIEWPKQNIF